MHVGCLGSFQHRSTYQKTGLDHFGRRSNPSMSFVYVYVLFEYNDHYDQNNQYHQKRSIDVYPLVIQ